MLKFNSNSRKLKKVVKTFLRFNVQSLYCFNFAPIYIKMLIPPPMINAKFISVWGCIMIFMIKRLKQHWCTRLKDLTVHP